MTLLKVVYSVRTCIACPSQWDIYVEDGRQLYARYRHGYFYLAEQPLATPLLQFEHGDDLFPRYVEPLHDLLDPCA